MKVSVIIPCYNFEEYIEQSILSAVSQKTNFEFEVLVRDDFSSDNSKSCIERVAIFNSNVRFFNAEENIGATNNILFLISQSNAEYIAYLDGDDYWTDVCKLQKQIDYMDSNLDCIMTFTGHWMKEGLNYSPGLPYQWLCLPDFLGDELKTENLLGGNYSTFGRVFRNVKIEYKEEELNSIYFDWVNNYELSKLGKIKYLDFPSGVYRAHSGGVFSNKDTSYIEERANKLRSFLSEDYKNYKLNNE